MCDWSYGWLVDRMTAEGITKFDEALDWPLSAAEVAEAERERLDAWGTGPEAQAGLQAALAALGATADSLPVAD